MKLKKLNKVFLKGLLIYVFFIFACSLPVERVRVVEITKEVEKPESLESMESENKTEADPEKEKEEKRETDSNPQTEAKVVSEIKTEGEAERATESEPEKEEQSESEKQTDTEEITDPEQKTERESENATEQKSETAGENEAEERTESEAENMTEPESESETDNKTESESGNEAESVPEAEVESGKESEAEVESNPEPQPEPEPESETGPEPEPEPEPESETEPELPPEPMQEIPDPPKLTIVVYMAADNDLESYAIQNLKAMEHADFKKMNVLVLLDRSEGFDETNGNWTDTRLFELVHDDTDSNLIVSKRISCPPLGLSSNVDTELDMGNPSVLWNLMNFVRKNYESEKYALIIWGHGTGWRYAAGGINNYNTSHSRAIAIDDRTGSYMSVHDMGRALRNQGLSVIGFDTCFGGVFENVYELKNLSEYTVASPGMTPAGGWDYESLLENLAESNFTAQEIADSMAESSLVNITIFNNKKLYSLMNDFEDFSKALAATINNTASRNEVYIKLMSLKSYSYTQYPCDLYLDLNSMAEAYKTSSDQTLAAAAKKMQKTLALSAKTNNPSGAEVGIHFITKTSANTTAVSHSIDYIKDVDNSDQCMFIKESQGWVPTKTGESESLLDKLFYADL